MSEAIPSKEWLSHRRLPTSLQNTHLSEGHIFSMPWKQPQGWIKWCSGKVPHLMWRRGRADGGEIKQNLVLFHPDPVNRGGRQQPHEGARGNTETKSLCEETNSSSPKLVSSRVQISFHTTLLGLPSSLPYLRAALCVMLVGVQHGHPPRSQNGRDLSGAQLCGVRIVCSTGKLPGEGKAALGKHQQQRHTDHKGFSSHLHFYPQVAFTTPVLHKGWQYLT